MNIVTFPLSNVFSNSIMLLDKILEMLNFSGKLVNEMPLLLDMIIDQQNGALNVQYHVPHDSILPLFFQAIMFILKFWDWKKINE